MKEQNGIVTLYHGSPNIEIVPTFGLGEARHDYGKGFYLTDLSVLDFQNEDILSWLAELMKHRKADDSRRYRILSEKFIKKYGVDTSAYDVIKGWRANASYFYIAKAFVRDEIDLDILEKLMMLGELGIQYCIKSEKAYSGLKEVKEDLISVEYHEFNQKYNKRDVCARENMRYLINSDKNMVSKVFSTLV